MGGVDSRDVAGDGRAHVDGLPTRPAGLGREAVGPLERPHLRAAVDDEASQEQQPQGGDADEQRDGPFVGPAASHRDRKVSTALDIEARRVLVPGRPGTPRSLSGTEQDTPTRTIAGVPAAAAKPVLATVTDSP